MRILYFGDGLWASNSLIRLAADGRTMAGVVMRTKPSSPDLLNAAEKLGIPTFQPSRVNAPDFTSIVAELKPDLNLSLSYNQILRRPVLEAPPKGSINFHAGKLPNYRGRNVINWAIINGEMEIGLTAHYMDDGIDTGDIILQRTLPVAWTDTYDDVLSNVIAAMPDLVSEAAAMVADGKVQRQSQAPEGGTYYGGREDGDEWLDWSDTSLNLYNKIRGITLPGPGARTLLEDRPVIIWRARYDPQWPKYRATPGQIIGIKSGEGVVVKTGDSTLLIQESQVAGDAPNIPNWPIGTRLGINLPENLLSLLAKTAQLEEALNRLKEQVG